MILNMKNQVLKKTVNNQRGMTLLEIMIVITILGILAGMVGVMVVGQLHKAKVQAAKIQIKNFESALEHYKLAFSKYPNTSEGMEALVNPPEGEKPILAEVPLDPWRNDYVYISPGVHNTDTFDIESYGADGSDGGDGDNIDIENWSD